MQLPPGGHGPATVHLLAGLNGAGKSTHARRLESDLPAVRFTLDEWMLRLHQLRYDDPRYPPLAQSCQELIWDTALQVLTTGTEVVLDWNLWSRDRRVQWRDRAMAVGSTPVLHYVRVPIELAVSRAQLRNASGTGHTHTLDADAIRHLASIFEEPGEDEGMELRMVDE